MRFVMLASLSVIPWVVLVYVARAANARIHLSTYREEFTLPLDVTRLAEILDMRARGPTTDSLPYATVEAPVRAGFANLNLARGRIELWTAGRGCRVVVEAQAREGLIDQRTAFGAVTRVISKMRSMV
jgi:hypothetical protein